LRDTTLRDLGLELLLSIDFRGHATAVILKAEILLGNLHRLLVNLVLLVVLELLNLIQANLRSDDPHMLAGWQAPLRSLLGAHFKDVLKTQF